MKGELREHEVDFASDLASGRKKIAARRNDICFIDLKLGAKTDKSGLELVPLAAKAGAYCVVMSGRDSEAVVERAYELGCDDFYAKGNEEENVSAVVARFLRKRPEGGEDRLFKDLFIGGSHPRPLRTERAVCRDQLRGLPAFVGYLISMTSLSAGRGRLGLRSIIRRDSGGDVQAPT